MSNQTEFATLYSVTYDKKTDKVYVTFEVNDDKYKDFAMRIAQRDDVSLIIRGEKLDFVENSEEV